MAKYTVAEDRARVSFTPKKRLLADIDLIAEKMGVSRSICCQMLVATAIDSYKKILELPPERLDSLCQEWEKIDKMSTEK